jgi:hypothetical protein
MLGFPNGASMLANFGFAGGWSWWPLHLRGGRSNWPGPVPRASPWRSHLPAEDSPGLSEPQTPSPWSESLTRVTPTRPESSLSRSPFSDPGLTATTLLVSSPCLPLHFWQAMATPEPPYLALTPTPATSPSQPLTLPCFDLPCPISITQPRSRDTASRTRAPRPDPPVSACASWRWAQPVSPPPSRSLTPPARLSAFARPRARPRPPI